MTRPQAILLSLLLSAFGWTGVIGQNAADTIPLDSLGRISIFDAMGIHPDSFVQIQLKTDLPGLIRNRTKELYQDASLALFSTTGIRQDYRIEVKARGKTRKEICSLPPIKTKWKRKQLDSLGFSRHHEMKLVLQCKPGSHFEQILLREFMAYRLYNLISPYGYRVQLANLKVTDLNHPEKEQCKLGFFLEDDTQFEERTHGVLVKTPPSASQQSIRRQEALRLYVFQYMIGNTDWSLGNLHNVHMLQTSEDDKLVIVPYDFDYAGLVSAAYAVPHENIPIKDVRERYYKGLPCTPAEIDELTAFYLEKKDLILTYCQQFPAINEHSRKDIISYLEAFFALLESKSGLHQVIPALK